MRLHKKIRPFDKGRIMIRVTTFFFLFFAKKTSAGTKIPLRANGRIPPQPVSEKTVGAKLQGHLLRHSCVRFQQLRTLCGIVCRILSFSQLLS